MVALKAVEVIRMVRLERAGPGDAVALLKIQRQAFAALLEKYQDYDTNPAAESLEWMQWRLDNPERDCWFILANGKRVGLVCTKPVENGRSISPIGLVPEFQGQGIGREAVILLEAEYPNIRRWELGTILQEATLCRFYESLGYRSLGIWRQLKPGMDLVGYEKRMTEKGG